MNPDDAKKILALYRPDSDDKQDPAFFEALELARRTPTLEKWFEEHCVSHSSNTRKMRQIAIPAGLKEQILAERKIHALPLPPSRRQTPLILWAMAAAIAMVLLPLALIHHSGTASDDLSKIRLQAARTAMRTYDMDLPTSDLDRIRAYLAATNAPPDTILPAHVTKAQVLGCATLKWNANTISMICFKSGRPTRPGQTGDLWLFVFDSSIVHGSTLSSTPSFQRINRLTTATWTDGKRDYILAGDGDQAFVEKYL